MPRGKTASSLAVRLAAEDISDPVLLPVSGTAQYQGFMTAGLPLGANGKRQDYIGDMSMAVNFSVI